MKHYIYILSALILFLASCSSTRYTYRSNTDDLYYSSSDAPVQQQQQQQQVQPQNTMPFDSQSRSGQFDNNPSNPNQNDNYVSDNFNNDDYVFHDENDYFYSQRLRRFYQPYYGYSYFSDFYTYPFYWWNDPFYYNSFFSMNVGPVGFFYRPTRWW
ncbi:MAG: hypothetical protein ACK53R_11245, partial [Bacteroidota bacterium]